MTTSPKVKKVPAQLTPVDDKKRVEVEIKVPKTENIIFIGSEMWYDSFWLKMMFVGAAYAKVNKLRAADKKTVAFVDVGYTHLEKMAVERFRDKHGFEIVKLASSADIVALMNKDRENYKLLDVAFFSHGVIDAISMNYHQDTRVRLDKDNYFDVNKNAFAANGRIYSYACRTGVSVEAEHFASEADAKPERSLAQRMATHFDIEVHAFLRRSHYGGVLRDASQSNAITSTLNQGREKSEGSVIQIPPDHEALPHTGLADKGTNKWYWHSGAKGEGTNGYALWRREGGIRLPVGGDGPTGLGADMRVFKPVAKPKPKE